MTDLPQLFGVAARCFRPALHLLVPVGLGLLLASAPAWADTSCSSPLSAEAQAAATLGLVAPEREVVHLVYRDRAADCVWNDNQIAALQTVLTKADELGLDPARYHAESFGNLAGDGAAEMKDVFATAMALRYAHDLVMGRVDPAGLTLVSDIPKPPLDLMTALRQALATGNVAGWLAALVPDDPAYTRLIKAMRLYRDRVNRNEFVALPPGGKLQLGRTDPRVTILKARLVAEGDLAVSDGLPHFDLPTKSAVELFQRRHGINPTGKVDRETFLALNISDQERLNQILANLERWRHFGHVLPVTRIEVNLADATARLIADRHDLLTMRVIVGDPGHPSPMLISDHVAAIVLNPPWVVPASIIKKEIMPHLERDPEYLQKNDMEWRGTQLVQSPGARNALGHIKFDFRNPFSVYMHDTPSRNLFVRYDRARSHGCVRLERPMDLALLLLKDYKNWPRERIEQKIAAGGTIRIELNDGPPVVFAYWTVFVDDDGTVEFRNDIYGVDGRIAATLAVDGKAPVPPKQAKTEAVRSVPLG